MVAELESTPEPSLRESQLSIRSVWKSFGGAPVLRDVDLDVASGELVALLGPSGCGKTTLLRLIAGFIAPDSGTIVIDNKDQTKVPPHRRRVGMVHQNYALWPHMTVAENVSFGLEMRGESRDEIVVKVDRILEMVELDGYKTRLPGQLSGGQQQRVSLARALVTEPEVMLLDEPLSSLDANLRSQLQRHLRDVVKTLGVTTVMVTHDREEAMAISNRIVAMRDGAVVQSDSARGLYHDPVTPFVMQFTGDTNLFWGAVVGNSRSSEKRCEIPTPTSQSAGMSACTGWPTSLLELICWAWKSSACSAGSSRARSLSSGRSTISPAGSGPWPTSHTSEILIYY